MHYVTFDQAGRPAMLHEFASAPEPADVPPSAVEVDEAQWLELREQTAWAAVPLAMQARQALAQSDVTVLRCYEQQAAVPSDWVAYRAALRAIVAGGSGPLPARPAYPA